MLTYRTVRDLMCLIRVFKREETFEGPGLIPGIDILGKHGPSGVRSESTTGYLRHPVGKVAQTNPFSETLVLQLGACFGARYRGDSHGCNQQAR